jgi:peroxiredoxin
MKNPRLRILVFLAMSVMSVPAQTNQFWTWDKDFVKTNGEYVIIGGHVMIPTNSPSNTYEAKQFLWREELLKRILKSDATNKLDRFVEGTWALAKEYPARSDMYYDLESAVEDYYDFYGNRAKARALAEELAHSAAPENIKSWIPGFLHRLDLMNRTIAIKFTAVDGREVDLAQLKGKVVLVDFWATGCGGCKIEMPFVKAAYDEFHTLGLEIIGISLDTDKEQLNRFIKEKDLPWPQYFDSKGQMAKTFGIDGIPHIFLLDKQGVLRFDNVRAGDKHHPVGDTTSLESKIKSLLAAP